MNRNSKKVTRRKFLGGIGLGLAVPYVLPSGILSAAGAPPPSERINLGFIGVGGIGGWHLNAYLDDKEHPPVAVCDVDEVFSVGAASRVGPHCRIYNDFRDLLDDKDVDAVVVAVPDHWHALIAVYAAQAGKDIYCEKPLSLTIREAQQMVAAARRYGTVFQTGSQQRSASNFRFACELVQSGRIGKIQTVHVGIGGPPGDEHLPAEPVPEGLDWDMWLGPAPERPFNSSLHPFHWRWQRDFSGGNMTDWGAHHFDIAQWGLGMDNNGPVEIHPPDGKEYDTLTFKYANGVTMFHGGAHGVLFTGTDGKIEVDRGYLRTWPDEIGKTPLGPGDVHLYKSPGHHADWLDCIRTRRRPICDVATGASSVTVCHLANIALWLNRSIRWDPEEQQIIGDTEASRQLDRPKRAPWRL